MSKNQFPNKILWLASYPKSGNTWFRAFLTALLNGGKVEINRLDTDGIFSQRETFDRISELESRDLYREETESIIADVYRYLALESNRLKIIKIHDYFGYDKIGNCLVPEDVSLCAIYFIRNPLDIAGSLANHFNCTIDEAVKILNNDQAYMVPQKNNFNIQNQLPQLLSDWSSHVRSWTTGPHFPVHIVRYEDMVSNTFETFSRILKLIGWGYSEENITTAIEASSFENLKRQENMNGFAEKAIKSERFFRSGTIGNWGKELNEYHIKQITEHHGEAMGIYGYG